MQKKSVSITKNEIGQTVRTFSSPVNFSGIFSRIRENERNTTGGAGGSIVGMGGKAVLYLPVETEIEKGDIVTALSIDWNVEEINIVPCFNGDIDHKKIYLSKIE